MKLSHLRLLVSDFDRTFAFYRDILGLPARFSDSASGYGEFDTGASTLALFSDEAMAEALGGKLPAESGRDGVALVFNVANVDDTYRDLRAKGVEFLAPPTDRPAWTVRTAHFRDPDGNLIEINSYLKRRPQV